MSAGLYGQGWHRIFSRGGPKSYNKLMGILRDRMASPDPMVPEVDCSLMLQISMCLPGDNRSCLYPTPLEQETLPDQHLLEYHDPGTTGAGCHRRECQIGHWAEKGYSPATIHEGPCEFSEGETSLRLQLWTSPESLWFSVPETPPNPWGYPEGS